MYALVLLVYDSFVSNAFDRFLKIGTELPQIILERLNLVQTTAHGIKIRQ